MATQKVKDSMRTTTALDATKLTGALPAISGAALTGVESAVKSASDPTITSNKTLGTEWINTTSGEVYILTTDTTDQNVWTNIGDGTGTIQPNQPPGNPTDDFPDLNESSTTTHTFTGGTDADGTVTHYKVDTISNSSLLAVTTAEIAAGSVHTFTTQAVSADTNVTFRVRTKDNLGSYSSGITVTTSINNLYAAHFLLLAGGGSSGIGGMQGGAGAGGLRTSWTGGSGGGGASESQQYFAPGTTYTCTPGAGGTGHASSYNQGVASTIEGTGYTTLSATGGGYAHSSGAAGNGGCGGGGATAGTGLVGSQGFNGASPWSNPGPGGGGTGEAGNTDGTGYGGDGKQVDIDGNNYFWGGGGGGGGHTATGGVGGQGGGGGGSAYGGHLGSSGGAAGAGPQINSGAAGVASLTHPGGAGGVNAGGGAGGGSDSSPTGANGGSGIVIIRAPAASITGGASPTVTGGPTVATVGSDTVITFTGVGTFVA